MFHADDIARMVHLWLRLWILNSLLISTMIS